jgi:pentatricopeptide repeat protein
MQSQGLLPNVVTYTTLVDIYGRSGRFDDAIECLEDMKSAGLKPSSTMYNALINAYAQRVCLLLTLYVLGISLYIHLLTNLLLVNMCSTSRE